MLIIRTVQKMQAYSKEMRRKGKRTGFVPTMGALHEGHLSLIRRARKDNDLVVVSIFVNPCQFGPREDFKKYPRNFKHDASLCKNERVDCIFYPAVQEMYPGNYKTFISVEGLSDALCGKSRPGHFRGVATVVAKLFNIIQPDNAYFGQKDAQQSVIIKKMAADLNMPVSIKVIPTVRDKDGLALSSRNRYLSVREKQDAKVLSQALKLARLLVDGGQRSAQRVAERMKQLIQKKKSLKIEYISLVDADNLVPLTRISGSCIIALAAKVGKTRLIDNLIIRGVS